MALHQRFKTHREIAEACVAAVLDDPDAILAELVRRGALVETRPGHYARTETT